MSVGARNSTQPCRYSTQESSSSIPEPRDFANQIQRKCINKRYRIQTTCYSKMSIIKKRSMQCRGMRVCRQYTLSLLRISEKRMASIRYYNKLSIRNARLNKWKGYSMVCINCRIGCVGCLSMSIYRS